MKVKTVFSFRCHTPEYLYNNEMSPGSYNEHCMNPYSSLVYGLKSGEDPEYNVDMEQGYSEIDSLSKSF